MSRTVVMWQHPKHDGVRVVADLDIIEGHIKDLQNQLDKVDLLGELGYTEDDINKLIAGGLKL